MIVVSPAANSFENGRSACTAMRKPQPTNSRNRDEHRDGADAGRAPHRSPRTRSRSAAFGIFCGLPSPSPVPANPPLPNANIDCTIWKPLSCATDHGSIQVLDAVLHVAEELVRDDRAAEEHARDPTMRYAARSVAM